MQEDIQPSRSASTSRTPACCNYKPDRNESIEGFEAKFWKEQFNTAESDELDFKRSSLPLARIKKVMKTDPSVKMIAAEVPIIFSKACEAFIEELALRAWMEADRHDRKTLGRPDVAAALKQSDMYDFLIDIVPREDPSADKKGSANRPAKRRRIEGSEDN